MKKYFYFLFKEQFLHYVNNAIFIFIYFNQTNSHYAKIEIATIDLETIEQSKLSYFLVHYEDAS